MDRLGFFKHGLSALMDAATSVIGMKKAVESMTEAVEKALSDIRADVTLHLPSLEAMMYEDAEHTLGELAQMGYTSLEVGAYFPGEVHDKPLAEFYELAKRKGLRIVSAHLNHPLHTSTQSAEQAEQLLLQEQWWSRALDEVGSIGARQVSFARVPSFPAWEMESLAKEYAAYFEHIARWAQQRGMKFCYHPSAAELKVVGEESFLDCVARHSDAQLVKFQIDTYEAYCAEVELFELLRQYENRIASLHLHDLTSLGESGKMDFDRILREGRRVGVKDILVEVSEFNLPPMNCVERSIHFIESLPSV